MISIFCISEKTVKEIIVNFVKNKLIKVSVFDIILIHKFIII
jgi:hypothetical protein